MIGLQRQRRNEETVVRAYHAERLAIAIDLFERQPFEHHLRADIVAQHHHADDCVAQRNDDARRQVAEHAARHFLGEACFEGDALIKIQAPLRYRLQRRHHDRGLAGAGRRRFFTLTTTNRFACLQIAHEEAGNKGLGIGNRVQFR
ncbi:hypothetical protein D9M69_571250 [compost metagenome]